LPFGPAAVVLHVEPARRVHVASDLVHALAKLGERIRQEAGADASIGSRKRLAAVFAQVMAPGRNAEGYARAVAVDRVHAESAVAGTPLASVLVVADAPNHFPGIAAVAAAEQRCRLDSAPEILLVVARFERPDVGERAAVFLGESRGGLRLLELLAEIRRHQ